MLPRALCRRSIRRCDGELRATTFNERDHAWLDMLLDDYRRHAGRQATELQQHLAQPRAFAPRAKLAIARHVLDRLCKPTRSQPLNPSHVRWAIFRQAAGSAASRSTALASAAAQLGVSTDALERGLFADLDSQREVGELAADLTSPRLVVLANAALLEGLVACASELEIHHQPAHGVELLELSHHIGVIGCPSSEARTRDKGWVLQLVGPHGISRLQRRYREALLALVSSLPASCRSLVSISALTPGGPTSSVVFELDAERQASRASDFRGGQQRERLGRELETLAEDWQLSSNPNPLSASNQIVVVDFELRRRAAPATRVYVQLAGFWTESSLRDHLQGLRDAGLSNVLVCVDDRLCCTRNRTVPTSELGSSCLGFDKRLAAQCVLQKLDALCA